jgi:hypothetical protein
MICQVARCVAPCARSGQRFSAGRSLGVSAQRGAAVPGSVAEHVSALFYMFVLLSLLRARAAAGLRGSRRSGHVSSTWGAVGEARGPRIVSFRPATVGRPIRLLSPARRGPQLGG